MRHATGLGIHQHKRIVNWLEEGKRLSDLIEYGSPVPDAESGLLLDHMNEIKSLIKSRRKIEAQKLYREATGFETGEG